MRSAQSASRQARPFPRGATTATIRGSTTTRRNACSGAFDSFPKPRPARRHRGMRGTDSGEHPASPASHPRGPPPSRRATSSPSHRRRAIDIISDRRHPSVRDPSRITLTRAGSAENQPHAWTSRNRVPGAHQGCEGYRPALPTLDSSGLEPDEGAPMSGVGSVPAGFSRSPSSSARKTVAGIDCVVVVQRSTRATKAAVMFDVACDKLTRERSIGVTSAGAAGSRASRG